MRKLWLVALAASAALVPMTAAQAQQGPGPARTRVMVPSPHPGMGMPHGPRQFPHRMGGHHRFQRIDRGGFIPPFWFGPQFHVQNWGLHGFPQPMHGRRWIRYYDDALLIDGDGRVHDGRYGWDWDRYGERWGEDENGIPVYVGDGDFEPGDWDYEWAEAWERGDHRGDHRGDRRGGHAYGHDRPPPPHRCGNPCTRTYSAPPPAGYGYGGYGYYGWGPVIVTETIVTTAPVVEQVTTYEYIEEEVRVAPRKRRPVRRCNCPRPAPRPQPGERG
jgi:Ni/Co efflux regulator RcnB